MNDGYLMGVNEEYEVRTEEAGDMRAVNTYCRHSSVLSLNA